MTETKIGLLLAGAAVIGLAVALHRQRALGRAGLLAAVGATLAVSAWMFLTQ